MLRAAKKALLDGDEPVPSDHHTLASKKVMNREEKANAIIEACQRFLVTASKRSAGEWKSGKTCVGIPAIFSDPAVPAPRVQQHLPLHDGEPVRHHANEALALFGAYRYSTDGGGESGVRPNHANNIAFITGCSRQAEFMAVSTIGYIKHLRHVINYTLDKGTRSSAEFELTTLLNLWDDRALVL